ncbi:MAG: NapC/NirT cytochrome c domain protein [Tardiphaga sp.]|nr:NapC/NirT cytochrome c domain protein [Tardiphaga sp.]
MKFGLLLRWWTLAPVLLLGAIIGVIGWGGFNTAMEATNSLEFCVSCHEMRDNVFQAYKKTIHYQNASGVRAICSDCHVPRDWTHKIIRKIEASNELYHWALGSIDSRQKFEAKRHQLARHEWERMRANDSRECRNCHSFEAMDFHRQTPKAATAMTAAMKTGQTCIDCHKGIAHQLPDIAAEHRTAFAELTASAKALTPAVGAILYAIGPTSFSLDHTQGDDTTGGELDGAAPAKVLGVAADALQIEISGWQRAGSPEVLYQSPGKRILLAKLSAAAVARAVAVEIKVDPDTDQEWTRVRLVGWTKPGRFVASIEPLWRVGATMYDNDCSMCHALHPPDSIDANDWIGRVNAMRRFSSLDDDEVALLQAYLQNHAKDVVAGNK